MAGRRSRLALAAPVWLALALPAGAQTTFSDATTTAGLSSSEHRLGSSWGDFDGDGLPDVLIGSHFYAPPTLYRNRGGGRFEDVTTTVMEAPTNLAQCVVPGEPVGPWGDQHGRAWADFDNDGDQDLIQLIGAMAGRGCGPNQLYVNDGGRLADRAVDWGIDYPYSRGRMPVWFDYDGDGRLDLYQGALTRPDGQAPPTLFRGTPDGFVDVRNETGFRPVEDRGAFVADLLGGSGLELLVGGRLEVPLPLAPAAVRAPDTSLRFVDTTVTAGQPLFKEVTPLDIPLSGAYDIAIGDFDGDLRQDLFIAQNWAANATPKGHRLYLNLAAGFTDASASSGINALLRSSTPSTVAGDFDNDGDLDIYYDGASGDGVTTSDLANVILWNKGDGTFTPDPLAGGARGPGGIQSPPDMVSLADYDVDGRLDILLTYFKATGSTTQLYRNTGNGNHWLEIDLVGVAADRDAIGAKVFLTAGGKTQMRGQNGGVHFEFGQNHQRLHFGLGANTSVQELRVVWPGGPDTVIADIPADRLLRITQAAPIGEVGRIARLDHRERTIPLTRAYADPVVFAQPISRRGLDYTISRVTSVARDRFTVRLQEAENLDGLHPNGEDVSYLVIERGSFVAGGKKLESGSRSQGGTVWQDVALAMPFSTAPVVVSQTQTAADARLVQSRQRPVAGNSRAFSLMLEGSEAQQRSAIPHGPEQVGWLALDAAGTSLGDLPVATMTAAVSSTAASVRFPTPFAAPPALIGGLATFNGSDPASLRYQTLTAADVVLRIDEDTTADSETTHGRETASVVALGVATGATATIRGSRIEWLSPGSLASPAALQEATAKR